MIYNILENVTVQFMFQLLVAESVFLIGMSKKKHFLLKFIAGIGLEAILSYLLGIIIAPLTANSLFPFVLLYFGYASLSIIPILSGFDIEIKEIIFIMVGGYATEHMTFALSKITQYLLHIEYQPHGSLIHLMITRYVIYIIGAFIVYFLIIKTKKKDYKFKDGDFRIIVLALIIMIFAIGFSVYWSYPKEYAGTKISEVLFPAYSFLCCALVLIMEYYVLRENGMKRERDMMEQLMQMSNTHQKSSQDAIDIINMKCHDLKHQMKALAEMEDNTIRNEYLNEIREAVSIYDATYYTGCNALDYVLREKTLIFNEREIEFSCMVEGKMITYMSPADVYALMGNALENALERVLREDQKERVISLHIKHHNEMVLIHLENRCSGHLEFENGIPITDKKDKRQHGFGIKSMQYIVKKYHGELVMSVKKGRFHLDILFPLYL